MCATCGCGNDSAVITLAGDGHHDHHHDHPHDHEHPHDHAHVHTETISLEQKVLAKNDLIAEGNGMAGKAQHPCAEHHQLAGRGQDDPARANDRQTGRPPTVSVIEGDQETLLDAERIRAAGAAAVQVNTGAGCHLDAEMVRRALETLNPQPQSLLFIENVGNLVCPAMFDLGEHSKLVVISVTEGADKPLKYPHMFAAAGLVVVEQDRLIALRGL